MKAVKLTPKERELFEDLKNTPGGGTPEAYTALKQHLLPFARRSS